MNRKSFSINNIALGNLRHRKRQYILLVTGIALALYFAATTLLFGYGLYTSVMAHTLDQKGEYDLALYGIEDDVWDDIAAEGTISRLGRAEVLGIALLDGGKQGSFPIAKYDKEAIFLTHRRLKEGAFPQKAGEIALDQSALARLRVDAGIGDTVTLTLRVPDGNDFLPGAVEKTYTLVGILYGQRIPLIYSNYINDNTDYTAGMVSPAEQVEPGGRGAVIAYGALSAKSAEAYRYWIAVSEAYDVDLDWRIFQFSTDARHTEMIFTGVCILIVGIVLVLACCLGIVNAFSANLDARRRQIGLLRAMGATRRQIRRIFRREALIIAVTAAPLGLGLSAASIYGAFALLGSDFHFVPNAWVLLGVTIAGILCIAVASGIPLRRAAAVSPMQAVRDVDLIRAVKKKAVRSRERFDAARLTASRANRIYKTRRISIGVMLASGILLFSAAAYIAVPAARSAYREVVRTQHYQVYGPYMSSSDVLVHGFHAPGLTEGDRREIEALPLVSLVEGNKRLNIKILPEKITPYATWDGWNWMHEYLSTETLTAPDTGEIIAGNTERNERYRAGKEKYGYAEDYLNIECSAIEEDRIRALASHVYEGRIDLDKLRSGEEVLLAAPQQYDIYYTPYDDGGYSISSEKRDEPGKRLVTSQTNDMFHAGDDLSMSLLYTDGQEQWDDKEEYPVWPEDAVRIDRTARIGALLDFADAWPEIRVITTVSGLFPLGYDVPYQGLSVTLSETPDPETESYIEDALTQIVSRIPGARMHSNLQSARESRQAAVQFMAVVLALVILMMAITVSMMNNTLSAHIRAGRRSIGTMRAVGMSDRVIFTSYLYQLLYLFVWGGGIGYGLSIVFAVLFKDSMLLGVQAQMIPFWQPVLFIALLFGICLLNVRARLRGVLHESVIDNIRVLG